MRLCLCDSFYWTDSVPASGFPLFRAAGLPRRGKTGRCLARDRPPCVRGEIETGLGGGGRKGRPGLCGTEAGRAEQSPPSVFSLAGSTRSNGQGDGLGSRQHFRRAGRDRRDSRNRLGGGICPLDSRPPIRIHPTKGLPFALPPEDHPSPWGKWLLCMHACRGVYDLSAVIGSGLEGDARRAGTVERGVPHEECRRDDSQARARKAVASPRSDAWERQGHRFEVHRGGSA